MRSSFPGQFANKPERLKTLWEGAIVALDANVLLDLYRYSDSTRAALINVLELLGDRIWISNQVAAEYFSNRLKLIGDQAKLYDGAISELVKLKAGFENQKQHPFIGVEALAGFVASFDCVVEELRVNKEIHDCRIYEDDIKGKVGDLFDGRVGATYSVEELEVIVQEGARRYEQKIPPGFKDASKGVGGASLSERCAPYGDYIGWLQLMDKSKEAGTGIIYVTGDNKEDWWLKQSGKTVGPLPSLVEEFIRETGNSFYMYQPDKFLEYANAFLHQEASPEAVEEIRETRLEEFLSGTVEQEESVDLRATHRLGTIYSGLDVASSPAEPSLTSGLTVDESEAYISNLSFRRDLAKSGLERRLRELDMMRVGINPGRGITQSDLHEEIQRFEESIKHLNRKISFVNSYLAAIISRDD